MTRMVQVRVTHKKVAFIAHTGLREVSTLQDFIAVRGAGKYKGLQLVNFSKVS